MKKFEAAELTQSWLMNRTSERKYIVSKTRYQYVTTAEQIIEAVKVVLSVRKSARDVNGCPVSLISAEAIIKNSPELFKYPFNPYWEMALRV